MGQPACSEEHLATFKSFYPASSIIQFSACCSPCQNSHEGKNKLGDRTPTKCNNCCIHARTVTCVFTPAIALVVAPLAVFGSANSFVVSYLEDDLQQIVKTIFKARSLLFLALAPVPAPVITAALHYKGSHERPLKARFLEIYRGKIYLEYYNFFKKC